MNQAIPEALKHEMETSDDVLSVSLMEEPLHTEQAGMPVRQGRQRGGHPHRSIPQSQDGIQVHLSYLFQAAAFQQPAITQDMTDICQRADILGRVTVNQQ